MLALGLCATAHACGPRPTQTIPRRLGGETRVGAFVPPFAYEAHVRGELALSAGEPAAAVAAFELATTAPDEDAYLLSRLAWAQFLSGDPAAAERTLEHAARVDPCSEAVWLVRADIAERGSDLEAAQVAYTEAARCAPHSSAGPLGLSRILSRLGEEERAQGVLQVFAERARDEHAASAALSLALSRGDAVAAALALELLLAQGPPRRALLEQAIERALTLGLPWLASRLLDHQVDGIGPGLSVRVHLACGDLERARGVLTLASEDALGGPAQASELAARAGLFERAETYATDALTAAESPRLRLLRAQTRRALGQVQGALDDLAQSPAPLARKELVALLHARGLTSLADELSEAETAREQAEAQ